MAKRKQRKERRLEIRLDDRLYQRIHKAAEATDQLASEWIRRVLSLAASRRLGPRPPA